MMQGKSNKAICRVLNLAEPTVKTHVRAILKVLKVTTPRCVGSYRRWQSMEPELVRLWPIPAVAGTQSVRQLSGDKLPPPRCHVGTVLHALRIGAAHKAGRPSTYDQCLVVTVWNAGRASIDRTACRFAPARDSNQIECVCGLDCALEGLATLAWKSPAGEWARTARWAAHSESAPNLLNGNESNFADFLE